MLRGGTMKIDRIYKVNRIDFLPPHLVNLVNPVYFLRRRRRCENPAPCKTGRMADRKIHPSKA
jgi:hypothetical protein